MSEKEKLNGSQLLHILVIEDDRDTRANLRDILELDEHKVTAVGSAAETFAFDSWLSVGAIILDRQLPDAHADELLPRLRSLAPQADVIIVTGFADLHSAIAALREGAVDYIIKPINPDALRATLQRRAERLALQQAKTRSEHMFRSLLEAAPCMIVILDPDGHILYLSPFAEQMTGYARGDVEGKIYGEVFIEDSRLRETISRDIKKVLSGSATRGFENSIRCQDGASRWMIWNAEAINYEGHPAVLAVGQDLTSVKQAQEKALQAERLAAIGQMVTGLAHESGNALARSQACLEMLSMEVEENAEAVDLIQRIQTAQDHLRQLYEEVRGYAASLKLDRDSWDLSFLWRQTWNNLSLTRKDRQATLDEAVHNVNLECCVDQFRMDQVFRNVFENALAACADPVHISIECAAQDVGGRPGICISLRDNGPGLGAEQKRRLFEPFFTTKAKGTGLGMPIAKRIVEAHGGSIAVGESTSGAEILIILPRDEK